jgi:hypothetical protein
MSNLSIRNVPPDIERAIAREAKKQNTTKTDIVIAALQRALGNGSRAPVVRRDIRHFFGQFSKKEFAEFERNTAVFSAIDEAEWR